MKVLAIFGPTGVGKTGVAISVAELLRDEAVAISCDALQVYEGHGHIDRGRIPRKREQT